ncbi:adenylate kinase [Candidatus Woesearchaeota archaeon]|nr:adenylate kinase [Candidatus Woesearchaeota archaeon]
MNIVLLGPPNVGKGTYATQLSERLEIPHISTGDIIREVIASGSEQGERLKQITASGQLVPDEETYSLLKARLQQPDCANGYILDGFPRNVAQAEMLERDHIAINHVLNFVARDKVIMSRMEGRLTCSNPECHAIYHEKNAPPKQKEICDKCGSAVAKRAEDTPEVMKERLRIYHEATAPLIEYYTKKELLVEIDANGGYDQIGKIIGESLNAIYGDE